MRPRRNDHTETKPVQGQVDALPRKAVPQRRPMHERDQWLQVHVCHRLQRTELRDRSWRMPRQQLLGHVQVRGEPEMYIC